MSISRSVPAIPVLAVILGVALAPNAALAATGPAPGDVKVDRTALDPIVKKFVTQADGSTIYTTQKFNRAREVVWTYQDVGTRTQEVEHQVPIYTTQSYTVTKSRTELRVRPETKMVTETRTSTQSVPVMEAVTSVVPTGTYHNQTSKVPVTTDETTWSDQTVSMAVPTFYQYMLGASAPNHYYQTMPFSLTAGEHTFDNLVDMLTPAPVSQSLSFSGIFEGISGINLRSSYVSTSPSLSTMSKAYQSMLGFDLVGALKAGDIKSTFSHTLTAARYNWRGALVSDAIYTFKYKKKVITQKTTYKDVTIQVADTKTVTTMVPKMVPADTVDAYGFADITTASLTNGFAAVGMTKAFVKLDTQPVMVPLMSLVTSTYSVTVPENSSAVDEVTVTWDETVDEQVDTGKTRLETSLVEIPDYAWKMTSDQIVETPGEVYSNKTVSAAEDKADAAAVQDLSSSVGTRATTFLSDHTSGQGSVSSNSSSNRSK